MICSNSEYAAPRNTAAVVIFFFFQAEDGIRDHCVTGVQTCALPISRAAWRTCSHAARAPPRSGRRCGCRRGRARPSRSEERRVGKEGRTRWSEDQYIKKTNNNSTRYTHIWKNRESQKKTMDIKSMQQ